MVRKISLLAAMVLFASIAGAGMWLGQKTDSADSAAAISQPGPTFTVPSSEIPKHWTIIAYGDTRFTNLANTDATNPKVRRWLVDRIATEHPDALLVSGDLPFRGAFLSDYDVFRQETAAWREEKLRVYPALGNHEMNGGEAVGLKNWWATFPELTGRRWYSVRFGKVYIVALDSDTDLSDGSPQQKWLAEQLANLPGEVQFVLMELHHPPVADGIIPQVHLVRVNEAALARFLDAAALRMKAKVLVVAGHIHNYERFERNGVSYIVSGGGGAKPYLVRRDAEDLYKNPAEVNFHYIKFSFDGKSLHATMYRVDAEKNTPSWEARDTFIIPAP